MAYTTADAVKTLLGRNYDTKRIPDVTQFIETAGLMLERVVALAADRGIAYSASRLEMIERWLSAHYYQAMDPAFVQQSIAGASGTFQRVQGGKGIGSTDYGAKAIELDYSGALASLSNRQVASGMWLGSEDG